jgi:urea transport system substrate-binding protein
MATVDSGRRMSSGLSRRRFLELSGIAGAAAVSGGLLGSCGLDVGGPASGRDLRIAFLAQNGDRNAKRVDTSYKCLGLAVDEINSAGGMAGRHVTVVRQSDSADGRATAGNVARLMARDPFDVLIAPLSDPQRRALASAQSKLNTVVVDASSSDGQGCSRRLVSMGQVPSQQVQPLALWVVKNAGTRIYAVRSEDTWSRAAAAALQRGLSQRKVVLQKTAVVQAGTPALRSVIQDVRQANPDVLWCLLPAPDAESFAEALSEMDVHSLVVMSAWDELSANAHPGLVAGAITTQPWFMNVSTPASTAFVKRYHDRYGAGAPVNAEGEATYDAVHLYRAAVERARTTSVQQVSDTLAKVEVQGPRGRVRIDPATRVAVAAGIIGVNSGKGTIEVHGDLGTVTPQSSSCNTA